MAINQEEGRTFGKISNLYDKSRIGYPKKLIDDIINYSKIKQNGTILDAGSGTGQATLLFAQRGFHVIGLDISQDMINVAKEKCSSFSKVSFRVGTFEEVDFSDSSLDVITSGMAWHWIKPEGREEKAYRILKNGGTLALFWSCQRKEESEFVKDVAKVLDKYGGINIGPTGSKVIEISNTMHDEFMRNSSFTSVEIREYDEDFEFSKEKYLDLIISYGWVQCLSDDKREELLRELKKLYSKYKEPILIPYKYVLLLAKKN